MCEYIKATSTIHVTHCTNDFLQCEHTNNIYYRFPDPEWLLAHDLPVQYGLQHAGDVLVLQGSTISWSRSLGFSVHSNWNIAHLNDLQFAQAYERHDSSANITPPRQSIVPIKTLTIDVALYLVSLQQALLTDNNNDSTISASLLARIAAVLQRVANEETTISQQLVSKGIDSSVEPTNATAAYCEVNGCQRELSLHYYRCESCDDKNGFTYGAAVPQPLLDDTVWCRAADGRKPIFMCIACADKLREALQLGSSHTMQALRRRHVTLEQLQQLAINLQKLADDRFSSDNNRGVITGVDDSSSTAAIAEHPVISLPLFKFDSESSINITTAAAASTCTPIRRHHHHHCNTVVAYDTDAAVNGVPTDDALIAQALKCDDSSMNMMLQYDWGYNSDVNAIATAGNLMDNSSGSSSTSSSTDRCKYIALAQQGIQTATVLSKLAARMSKHDDNNSAGDTTHNKTTGEAVITGAAIDDTSNSNSSSSSGNREKVDIAAQAAIKAANDSYIAFQMLLAVLEGKAAG
jgi:hypothetical protein